MVLLTEYRQLDRLSSTRDMRTRRIGFNPGISIDVLRDRLVVADHFIRLYIRPLKPN
jgi:hypothetical protein